MKATTYIKALLAVAITGAMSACDENSWNNHLDGFEGINDQPKTDVQTVEYTLTDANYSTIASLSDNVALAGAEGEAALKLVGTQKHFSADAPASKYVPAFLSTTNFPYFTLTNGSSVRLTYKVAENVPAEVTEAAQAQDFTIPAEEYPMTVWESDENYIDAFAPSHPASKFIPSILLDYLDANDGIYALVQYNVTEQEPVFGGGGSAPMEVTVFEQSFSEDLGSFTIDNINLPSELEYVWSWGGPNYGAKASAFLSGTSYASESRLVSETIDLTGISQTKMTFDHVVNKFPDLDFAKANCKLLVQVDGGAWQNVIIPTYSGNDSWSFINSGEIDLSAFDGKKIRLAFSYVSEDGKSGTWEVKNLVMTGMTGGSKAPAKAPGASVPTKAVNTLYVYTNDKWVEASGFLALSPSDYTEMGQSHPNLSNPEPYLSVYLSRNVPYPVEGDVRNIVWKHYANGATTNDCSQYTYDGSAWVLNDFVAEVTDQFVMNGGKWMFDPNVTITLPSGRNQELSTLYFQACVDWVFQNICKPLGDTDIKSGKFYVSSYGNNEYYSGTSAYQGNIDLRPDKAREQYPAGYEGMSDEEIVSLEKKRFMEEVMPGALSALHPDAKPLEGLDVLYTINFAVYTGSTSTYTAVFKVVGPGKFEPVSCTWDEAE